MALVSHSTWILEFFKVPIRKLISGGQTGVDQAALKAALAAGVEIGGWCPPNKECETGKIPGEFPLVPTDKARSDSAPAVPRSLRTELNVRDSDATCIITSLNLALVDRGTGWTASCTARFGKPLLSVDAYDDAAGDKITEWIEKHKIETLNVAGPSESTAPGIGARTFNIILRFT
ncbi:YpsA SLOG family protein [Candidatus Thiosymbion oneisti]|uniref:YpsA SLOG family protein n=1 Tax=Candidatus Thiosymbion oneisti TaxID=589554 RepID=UPI000B7F7A5F|nr:putative molybdenum carrier protein [Candidatus Thiosymbion oneisti]